MSFDLTPAIRAQLNYSEFGRLCGVSRATARLWLLVPGTKPRSHHIERATQVIARIEAALSRGTLPLQSSRKNRRDLEIQAALDAAVSTAE